MRFFDRQIQKRLKGNYEARVQYPIASRVVFLLAAVIPLPEKNKDHMLTGAWTGQRECHITPD